MPVVKHLTCSIERDDSKTPLHEFHTAYGDDYAETYIAVPDTPTSFSIRLQSDGYIAPGLSMFVFMDGVYQCNRNRQNLKRPTETESKNRTEFDFRVRQKEQMAWDGTFAGRLWTFAKVNTEVANSSINADDRAPHNGEYVGTIEVVVLRCHEFDPTTSSIGSATTLVDSEPPSDGEMAKGVPLKAAQIKKSVGPKPKQKRKSKAKAKHQSFGLDGAWDDPELSAPLEEPAKKAEIDPWDNFAMPALPEEGSSSKSWENWGQPSPAKDDVNMGTVEMTSASEGVYKPVHGSKPSESQSGSQVPAQQHSSHQASKVTDQQDPTPVHIRGGGSETQSIKSRHSSGRDSPFVVNNSIVYNGVGTPPPLSAGPPASSFWKNLEAAGRGSKEAAKATSKPAAAANAWGDIPASFGETKSDAKSGSGSKDKVDKWNADGSGMPGSWGSFDQPQNDNENWGAVENDHNSQENDNSDTTANLSGWDWPENDGSRNGNGSKGSNDKANGDSNDWADTGNNGDQDDGNWGTNDFNHDTQANAWDTSNGNDDQQDSAWKDDKAEPASSKSTEAPKAGKKGKKKQRQPQAKPTGPKANTMDKPVSTVNVPITSKQPKKGNSLFNWFGSSSKDEPEVRGSPASNKKSPTPGSWSPPLVKSKKETSPKAAGSLAAGSGTQIQAQPSLSISATCVAKPYWSTWGDKEGLEEIANPDDKATPAETPLYAIPKDLVERNKTSHQIRPSPPIKYSHKVSKPKYMDTHEHPYAVFVFQYRDKEVIEQMFSESIAEPEIDEKKRLSSLTKEQLVEELIKAKNQSGSSGGSGKSSDKATFKSNPDGVPHGPDVSALTQKLSKLAGSKAPTPEKVGGWLQSGDDTSSKKGNRAAGTIVKKTDSNEDWGGWGGWGGNDTQKSNGDGDNWNKNGESWNEKDKDNAWGNDNNADSGDDKKEDNTGDAWDNQNNDTTTGEGGDSWGNWDNNSANEPSNPKDDDNTGGDTWGNWDNKSNDDNNNETSNKRDSSPTGNNGWDFNFNDTTNDTNDNSWNKDDTGGDTGTGNDTWNNDNTASGTWNNTTNDTSWNQDTAPDTSNHDSDNGKGKKKGKAKGNGNGKGKGKKKDEDKKDDAWETSGGFGGTDTAW